MSRFVNRQATDEIVLANGDKVQVRCALTGAEQAELSKLLVRMRYDSSASEGDRIQAEPGEWWRRRLDILKAYIVSWDFKDDEGTVVPYSPELVDQLDDLTVDELAEAIDELQTKRAEENQKKATRR